MAASIRASAIALSICVLSVATSCSGNDEEPQAAPATTVAPTTTVTPTTAAATTTAAVPAGPVRLEILGGPDWLAADDRYLYVKRDNGYVDRIDPETNEVDGSIEVGPGELCQGIGVGFDAVWTCRGSDVARLDFASGRIEATMPIGKAAQQGTLAAGFDRVWVLLGDGSQLTGIDPTTNAADAPIELGARGTDLAVDERGVWVVSSPDGALLRIDPLTRAVTGRVDGLDRPMSLALGEKVWVGGATTAEIDPETLEVTATYEVGPGLDGALIADGDGLWVRSARSFLQRIDTTTGEVTNETADVTSGGDVLVAFDSVWVSAYDDAALFRLPAP